MKKYNYQTRKDAARAKAINWQAETSARACSVGELAAAADYFARLGRRFGLLTEFRENGII